MSFGWRTVGLRAHENGKPSRLRYLYDENAGNEHLAKLLLRSALPRDHFQLLIIILAGGMGAGKTTAAGHLADLVRAHYGAKNVHIALLEKMSDAVPSMLRDRAKKVFFLFVDDAVRKQDSRRAMSRDNVNSTQDLFEIRHLAENNVRKNGLIVLVWAAQASRALDIRIRETAGAMIWKSLPGSKQGKSDLNRDIGGDTRMFKRLAAVTKALDSGVEAGLGAGVMCGRDGTVAAINFNGLPKTNLKQYFFTTEAPKPDPEAETRKIREREDEMAKKLAEFANLKNLPKRALRAVIEKNKPELDITSVRRIERLAAVYMDIEPAELKMELD